MTLKYHPKLGEVMLCSFPSADLHLHDQALKGEMVKDRLVIVVNRRLSGRGDLVNVVPISMTPPAFPQPWHVAIPMSCIPVSAVKARRGQRYAKCDMICTVALARLGYYQAHWTPGVPGGSTVRMRESGRLDLATLLKVKRALAAVLEITPCVLADVALRTELAEIVGNSNAA
ncbi:MAG: type II toxin-antitoxin system PemK/MazF family toxin [Luteibacter sp.]